MEFSSTGLLHPASIRAPEYIRGIFIIPCYLLHQDKLPWQTGLPFSGQPNAANWASALESYCKHYGINLTIELINLTAEWTATASTAEIVVHDFSAFFF